MTASWYADRGNPVGIFQGEAVGRLVDKLRLDAGTRKHAQHQQEHCAGTAYQWLPALPVAAAPCWQYLA